MSSSRIERFQRVFTLVAMTTIAVSVSVAVLPAGAQDPKAKTAPKGATTKAAPSAATKKGAPAKRAVAKAAPKKYTVMSVKWDVGSPNYKQIRPIKDRVIAGQLPFAANRQRFEQWYRDYFFRSFTDPKQFDKLPLKRQELLADLKRCGRTNQTREVHNALVALTEQYMNGFAVSTRYNFHPAVRFNAMMVLGELNVTEQQLKTMPNPLPSALVTMKKTMASPSTSDAVKVAAMLGILRHAKLDWARQNPAQRIPNSEKGAIARQMIAILQAASPAGRSEQGHVWMQRRAIDILAALGVLGPMRDANAAIQTVLLDPKAPITLRCTAARALRSVVNGNQLDADAMSNGLASLAVAACEHELTWMDDLKEAKKAKSLSGANNMASMAMGGGEGGDEEGGAASMGSMEGMGSMMMGGPGGGGMGGSMGMGSMGMMPGMAGNVQKDPEIDIARRRLITKLICIKDGVEGVDKVATDDIKTKLSEVKRYVEELMTFTILPVKDDKKKKDDEEEVEELNTLDQLAVAVRKSRRDFAAIEGVVLAAAGGDEAAEEEGAAALESAVPDAASAIPEG